MGQQFFLKYYHSPQAASGGVLLKKLLLKIYKYSKETPVLESLFNKVAGL